jgi:hypothetical protein
VRHSLLPDFVDAMGKFEFFVYRKKGIEPSQIPLEVRREVIQWIYDQPDDAIFKVETKPDFTYTPVKGSFIQPHSSNTRSAAGEKAACAEKRIDAIISHTKECHLEYVIFITLESLIIRGYNIFKRLNIIRVTMEEIMLDIKVLGTGCAGCLKMEQAVINALLALGIKDARVELVTEQRMIAYGLLGDQAPGLLINGYLAWAGSVPTEEQVKEWIQHAATSEVYA